MGAAFAGRVADNASHTLAWRPAGTVVVVFIAVGNGHIASGADMEARHASDAAQRPRPRPLTAICCPLPAIHVKYQACNVAAWIHAQNEAICPASLTHPPQPSTAVIQSASLALPFHRTYSRTRCGPSPQPDASGSPLVAETLQINANKHPPREACQFLHDPVSS